MTGTAAVTTLDGGDPVDLAEFRREVRAGRWTGPTRNAAPGRVQCNLVILPAERAGGFASWCEANPSVAPVLARTEPGEPRIADLGPDIDLRTDAPRYRIFEHGEPVGSRTDLSDVWRDDLVAFAFGCSFSLEQALRLHGVPLPGEARGFGGGIYQTTRETEAAGGFGGELIVSMRPIPEAMVDLAVQVSATYPRLHGAPVHVGDPAAIGVDLQNPLESFGPVSVLPGEVPVFWACGVTTQRVVEHARPEFAVTHESAHMLVTDLLLSDVRSEP